MANKFSAPGAQRGEKVGHLVTIIAHLEPSWTVAKCSHNGRFAHNKVIVIDGQTGLTGSFNFTKAAEENNAENLLVIEDAALAAKYAQNWQAHLAHSELYVSRSQSKR